MFEEQLVYKMRGIIFDIYNNIAGNWGEKDYEDILFDELLNQNLKVERQKEFVVFYKGNKVGLYRTDLIIENKIILELKTIPEIFPLHQAQTISYLKVTGLPLAMLANFGGPGVYIKAFPNKFIITESRAAGNDLSNYNAADNSFKRQLAINFNINKLNISDQDKKLIEPYFIMSKDILEILGPGYFH